MKTGSRNQYMREYMKEYRKRYPEKFSYWALKKYRNYAGTWKDYYRRLKSRHKGRLISRPDFYEWFSTSLKECVFCGIMESQLSRMKKLTKRRAGSVRLSIDRKSNARGYEKGNLQFACTVCNSIKSDFFTDSEMRRLAQEFIKPKWSA